MLNFLQQVPHLVIVALAIGAIVALAIVGDLTQTALDAVLAVTGITSVGAAASLPVSAKVVAAPPTAVVKTTTT